MKRLGVVGVAGLLIVLWETRIPAGRNPDFQSPIFLKDRQYIVFAASSAAGGSAQLVAYALRQHPQRERAAAAEVGDSGARNNKER